MIIPHCLVLICLSATVLSIDHPEDFVNLLAGTFTDGGKFSTGNTLPLVGLPFGFNHWAPQTIDENPYSGSWWFKGSDHVITWLRCTHQPSPWIGDWGYFAFGPQVGPMERNPSHFWEPRGATIKPYIFDATVAPNGIRMELAPTMHGAMLRVTFPKEDMQKRICFTSADFSIQKSQWGAPALIRGTAMQVHHDRMPISNFALYIHAESPEATNAVNGPDMVCFQFGNGATAVHVRMATSLLSHDQAMNNIVTEVPPTATFEDIKSAARATWNK